jgi:predicted  nucleic acid-binding Zn-ribbon protein
MDGVSLPYLPTSLWLLAGALTILILLIVFGFYIYWHKRQGALLEDVSDAAELAARKQILQSDIEAIRRWMGDQKAELDRLTAEREEQERLRAVLAALEQQCAVKNQENQTLRNEVGELENQQHNLGQSLERMQREIGDLEARKAEAEALESRLVDLRSRLDEAQQTIRNLAELEIKLNGLSNEKISLERAVEDLRTAAASARAESNRFKGEAAEVRAEFEKLERELAIARREKAESEVIIDTLRHEQNALEHSVERLESKVEGLKSSFMIAQQELQTITQQAVQAKAEVELLRSELAHLHTGLDNMQRERSQLEITINTLRDEKRSLEWSIERLKEELGSLQGRRGKEEGGTAELLDRYKDLLEDPPHCLKRSIIRKMKQVEADEAQALLDLHNGLQAEGLEFSDRILKAFHTALKCSSINPITVLAGVSGTGKTLLPMRYAQMMGMHSLLIPVQPRWDSPQDIFGFYNYLEKQYKATDLSKALIRMNPYKSDFIKLDETEASEGMLLVLLDEMNLARTEYYFSEFLSKLEIRSLIEAANTSDRAQSEIVLETGPGMTGKFRIWVGGNVLFVGTMNEDETTQTLSDKVLDRSNVLRFGRPVDHTTSAEPKAKSDVDSRGYLTFNTWNSWIKSYHSHSPSPWSGELIDWTQRLNTSLERIGRPFGYRVQKAIGTYVSNYPGVNDGNTYKLAFADQVEQKIIPKLRGLDLREAAVSQTLEDIARVIDLLGDNQLSHAFTNAKEDQATGMFIWRGVTRSVNRL